MASDMFMRLAFVLLTISFVGVADQSAAILGKAVDPGGDFLSFPKVRLHEQSVDRRYETIGDGQGQFRIENVEPGLYAINISVPGFRDMTFSNVRIAPGQQLDLGVFRLEFADCNAPGGPICDDFGLSVYKDPIHAQATIKTPQLCAVDCAQTTSGIAAAAIRGAQRPGFRSSFFVVRWWVFVILERPKIIVVDFDRYWSAGIMSKPIGNNNTAIHDAPFIRLIHPLIKDKHTVLPFQKHGLVCAQLRGFANCR